MTFDGISQWIVVAIVFVIGLGFAAAFRLRGRALQQFRWECDRLQAALHGKEQSLSLALARGDDLQLQCDALSDQSDQDRARIEQLRDLVKVHVARRREFDEWADPIRATLGDSVGRTLQSLKEQLTHQEFTLRRQERVVVEAQDQYRGKHDELERMRRELTLKNYHIAALNERFIRIEERMQDLTAQVAGMGVSPPARSATAATAVTAVTAATERPPAADAALVRSPAESPETERFDLARDGSRDWMEVLDDWHRQLHQRFERMDELQARLRESGVAPARAPDARLDRSGGSQAS